MKRSTNRLVGRTNLTADQMVCQRRVALNYAAYDK